ncbi:MAG TPA: tetratricopeptide repeat protein [Xanthobacteraceae bacterium]|jgi:tetratricopeptide (TPR) repeat protein
MKTYALLISLLLAGASIAATDALAIDTVSSRDAPDLTSVRAKIKAKDFKAAIVELTPMLETHQHADVYNLMGFSLRKSGDPKQAYTFYRKALDFDPEHKGALEYLGELYVETGQVDKARENVVLLKKLCPGGCEELADLEQAIASASPRANATSAKSN